MFGRGATHQRASQFLLQCCVERFRRRSCPASPRHTHAVVRVGGTFRRFVGPGYAVRAAQLSMRDSQMLSPLNQRSGEKRLRAATAIHQKCIGEGGRAS